MKYAFSFSFSFTIQLALLRVLPLLFLTFESLTIHLFFLDSVKQ